MKTIRIESLLKAYNELAFVYFDGPDSPDILAGDYLEFNHHIETAQLEINAAIEHVKSMRFVGEPG
ncbi:MAG: hypothetical protein O7C39_08515 [Bacteroidetes bacterium]|nr:hypothetical protein [Bacteroidota bacterium]